MSRQRWILRSLLLPALLGLASACSYSTCVDAGGKCLLGGAAQQCKGALSQMDCDPNSSPAGSLCCVPCPQGQVFDAGTCTF